MKLVLAFAAGAAALDPLLARRSVVKYDAKAVDPAVTQKALEAAILAPNHFLSEPWRFYTCGPETKAKLCGLNEDKRKMAEGVPEWLVVTCASEHALDEKLGLEDHAAVACATQSGARADLGPFLQEDDAASRTPRQRTPASHAATTDARIARCETGRPHDTQQKHDARARVAPAGTSCSRSPRTASARSG